jgi:hypothetical protein
MPGEEGRRVQHEAAAQPVGVRVPRVVEDEAVGLVIGFDDQRRLRRQGVGEVSGASVRVAGQVTAEVGAEELLAVVDDCAPCA